MMRQPNHLCVWRLQVRDEYRTDYDTGRGGFGKIVGQEINAFSGAAAQPEKRPRLETGGGGNSGGRFRRNEDKDEDE